MRKSMIATWKTVLLAISAVVLMTAAISYTSAYYQDRTGEIENTFKKGEIPPEIKETFDNKIKKSVKVKNNGNSAAYIRVALNFTWVPKVSGEIPEVIPRAVNPSDYQISGPNFGIGPDKAWVLGQDHFYYHKAPVAAGAETAVLFDSLKVLTENGLRLNLEVLAQSIQASPFPTWNNPWPLVPGNDGMLIPYN